MQKIRFKLKVKSTISKFDIESEVKGLWSVGGGCRVKRLQEIGTISSASESDPDDE